jgi:hypothetical protein
MTRSSLRRVLKTVSVFRFLFGHTLPFCWYICSRLLYHIGFDLECVLQIEDITLCEDVQDGLKSPAYDVGRYAPRVEHAMHHFHSLLHNDLSS